MDAVRRGPIVGDAGQPSGADATKKDKFWKLWSLVLKTTAVVVGGLSGFLGRDGPSAVVGAVAGAVILFGATTVGIRAVKSGALSADGWKSELGKDIWQFNFKMDGVKEAITRAVDLFTGSKWEPPAEIHDAAAFKKAFRKDNAPPVVLGQDNLVCSGKLADFDRLVVIAADGTETVHSSVEMPGSEENPNALVVAWPANAAELSEHTAVAHFKKPSAPDATQAEPVTFKLVRPPIGPLGQARELALVQRTIANPWGPVFADLRDGKTTESTQDLLANSSALASELALALATLHEGHPQRPVVEAAVQALRNLPAEPANRRDALLSTWASLHPTASAPLAPLSVDDLSSELEGLADLQAKLTDAPLVEQAHALIANGPEALKPEETPGAVAQRIRDVLGAAQKSTTLDEAHPLRFALSPDVVPVPAGRDEAVEAYGALLRAVQHRRRATAEALAGALAAEAVYGLTAAPEKEITLVSLNRPEMKDFAKHFEVNNLLRDIQARCPSWNVEAVRIEPSKTEAAGGVARESATPSLELVAKLTPKPAQAQA